MFFFLWISYDYLILICLLVLSYPYWFIESDKNDVRVNKKFIKALGSTDAIILAVK